MTIISLKVQCPKCSYIDNEAMQIINSFKEEDFSTTFEIVCKKCKSIIHFNPTCPPIEVVEGREADITFVIDDRP